jgi:DNA-binding CsgD family transcriptional regulator
MLWRTCFDALALVDDDRRYHRLNEATAELFAAPADDVLGARIDDFTPGDRVSVLELLWAELERRGDLHGPYEMLRGDGERGLVEFRARRDVLPGRHLIVARVLVDHLAVEVADMTLRVGPAPDRADVRLTAREHEVLQLAADGGSTRDIAEVLVLSQGTIKTHFEHAYDKLDVRDRASAVAEALRRGLIR